MTLRKQLLKVHLYIGLVAGVFLAIAGITGGIMVYHHELDHALNHDLFHAPPLQQQVPLDTLVETVRAAYPEAKVRGIMMPQEADQAVVVGLGDRSVFIDPYSGRINGSRHPTRNPMMRVQSLHLTLLAGPRSVGQTIVGVVTFLGLCSACTGLYLWWPRRILTLRRGVPLRGLNFDLHNVVGFYTSALLVVITLSGVIMAWSPVTAPLLRTLDAAPPPRPPQSTVVPGASPLKLDELVRIARGTLPGAKITNFQLPAGGKASFRVQMRFPEDKTPGGRSVVFLDQYDGKALLVQSTREAGLGTKILNNQRSIHTGDLFPAAVRPLFVLASLALAVQAVTGALIWWKRA